jgi:uncharacterized protein (TIGR02145 family)
MPYTPSSEICIGGVAIPAECNGVPYNPLTQRCTSGNIVETMCGSSSSGEWYNASNQDLRCENGIIEKKCGNRWYNDVSQFCYENSKVGNFCGNRKAELDKYDPDKYECRAATNPNGIYLQNDINYGDEIYEAVLIGNQTWMAKNLNYKTLDGSSRCYPISGNTNSSDEDNINCYKYGRLYNWETAKTVCPEGWHLPNNEEWTALRTEVGGSASPYSSAGTHLRDKNFANGDDTHGFKALPGGGKRDFFDGIGMYGYWWSDNVYTVGYPYVWTISSNYALSDLTNQHKSNLFSVRCVKNNN